MHHLQVRSRLLVPLYVSDDDACPQMQGSPCWWESDSSQEGKGSPTLIQHFSPHNPRCVGTGPGGAWTRVISHLARVS